MPRRRIAALGLALLTGACAQVTPGYTPPSAKLDKIKSLTPTGGGFDDAGVYSLTDQERQLDCKRLTGSIAIKILQMRDAGTRAQPSAIAAKAQSTVQPLIGGTAYGHDLAADLRRDRARLEALNNQLALKKCPAFDLDAELKPGNTNPPRPVKPKAKA
jgi:hypothetical protein